MDRWKLEAMIPTFHLKEVNIGEVWKMLEGLSNSLAYGHDQIDSTTVKLAMEFLAKLVAHIMNLSLGTQTFPSKWKLDRVIPILKSSDADRNSPSSYRLVSQLSVISKITEKCVQKQLIDYFEETAQLN